MTETSQSAAEPAFGWAALGLDAKALASAEGTFTYDVEPAPGLPLYRLRCGGFADEVGIEQMGFGLQRLADAFSETYPGARMYLLVNVTDVAGVGAGFGLAAAPSVGRGPCVALALVGSNDAGIKVAARGCQAMGLLFSVADTEAEGRGFLEGLISGQESIAASAEVASVDQGKREFIAQMSHELRTPINGLGGSLELLLDSELTASQKENVDEMRISVERLALLVEDLLAGAKVGEVASPPVSAGDGQPAGQPGKRVLVIDEDALSRHLLVRYLVDAGCLADGVSDITDARLRLAAVSLGYDAIFMDCDLRGVDGLGAAAWLRRRLGPDVRIVGVTAHALETFNEIPVGGDMNEVLAKPVGQERIRRIVAGLGVPEKGGT